MFVLCGRLHDIVGTTQKDTRPVMPNSAKHDTLAPASHRIRPIGTNMNRIKISKIAGPQ